MKYIRFIPILLLAGCSSGNGKSTTAGEAACDTLTLAKLKREVLGRDVGSLPVYACYVSRDTILEGDEGVKWKGKAYYHDQQLVFLAETNWEDAKKIHRITVLGPQVKEGELFVDQRFKDVKGVVSDKIPSSPDGYLFLTYSKDTAISIQLDISGGGSASSLFNGVSRLDMVPDTFRIESIVIM